jgi:amino acid transporter
VLYICLELVFVGAVPGNVLAKAGWQGVNFSSPFAQIAMTLNLTWLLWLIYADALISPAGSSFVYTASNSRIVYGLAKNRFFPTFFANLHTRFGVPTRALLLNFVVGLLFLIPLKSWHSIISVTGSLGVFTYAAGAVSVIVFRRMNITKQDQRLRGMTIIAPLAFIVASLIIYWAGWSTLSTTIPLLIVGIIVYFISFLTTRSDARGILSGLWIIVYVAGLLVLSYLGSFDGLKVIPAPWDSVVAAVFALLIYIWAVSAGVAYMKQSSDVLSEVELNAEGQAMVTGD